MIRPVEPPSSVGRQSHQSEAATKTISDWSIRPSKEGDLVWFNLLARLFLPYLSKFV